MAQVLDWQRLHDPRAVIHLAVQTLRRGRLVALPTETGYALAVSGLVPEAVRQLPDGPPELALRGAAEARDWVPGMSPLAQRLARRLWPGPVTLVVGGDVEQGLAGRLADDVRGRVCPDGALHLRTSSHQAVQEVLVRLAGPLLLAPIAVEGEAVTAEQALRAAGERADLLIDDGPSPYPQGATVVGVGDDGWRVLRPGVVGADLIGQQTASLVVFVCTGNTCRSPLAEVLCKKQLADRLGCAVEELPVRGYRVLSAGLAAMMGGAAAAEAEQVAQRYGADLSGHRSQPLTPELAARADHLVAMTESHLRALADYPQLGTSPRLLDAAGEIADPIGHPQPVYEECGQQIWRHLEPLVAEIAPQRRDEG
jgi:protein-tyrosine phosphatase